MPGLCGATPGYRLPMERGSSKHGRVLDEQMAQEARSYLHGTGTSRTDEWREAEPAGDDQPEPTLIPEGARPAGAPLPLTGEDLERRSRLGRFIPRSVLPAARAGLLEGARRAGAPDDVLAELERLPADRRFATVYEIWAALGHENEPWSSTGRGEERGQRP